MVRFSLTTIIVVFLILPEVFAETLTGSVRTGNSFYSQGKYEEALKKYKSAQTESPADERMMFNLGNAQYKLERYDEALSEYMNAVQTEDTKLRAQSHYNAGNSLYRNGRLEEAVEQYLETLKIDPDDEDAKFNLEFVRREIQRRMKEQKQREQQKEKENEQEKKKENGDKDSPEKNESRESTGQDDPSKQNKPENKEKKPEQEEKSQPGEATSPKQTENDENQTDGAGKKEQREALEQGIDESNMQRWLDAIEAETAENMKEFLRNQQPVAASPNSEDW